ncbi:ABC transporter permease [Caldicellulosiruptor acetigenus]|uniref:ABC3 transporter permease C-terminal domain-containing protein n=1 Tax=Caldicellulosiruptor acetigenus 6A TaxID=632516 RepID=G2PVT4_9FIRM|nr:ABC transporter permease [Caldicellulosiruptor acetigenus]AEM72828.1 protein of unknown function DUF214 [Caldicellulosiruptor acetigenus 6A]
MVIKKIPLRVIKRELLQFISIILLTAMASMIYTLFSVSMEDVDSNYKQFIKDYVQEDGYFITSQPVDTKLVEKEFGIELEERLFYDSQEDEITFRVFSLPEKINLPYTQPQKDLKNGEIFIDPSFLKAHNLKIGENIKIAGKNFKIAGKAYLPDYIYLIKNDQDFLPDPQRFAVVIMTKEDMKNTFPSLPVHYYSYKGNVKKLENFKSYVNSHWFLLKFMTKNENPRIIYTEMKLENAKRMTMPLSLFIVLVSSFILFIVMRRVINSMHAEIGTLYSMGYTQKDVFGVFMRFALYIWIFGSILGICFGLLEASPFAEFYRAYFTLPKLKAIFPLKHIFVALFLPAVFIFLSCYLALRSFLKLTIVQMLHGTDEIKFGKLPNIKLFDKFDFKTRIMLKYGTRHFARELILLIGIIFSTILMMYGLVAKDSIVSAIEETYQKNFKYEYLYILNSTSNHPEINLPADAEKFNMMSFDVEGEKISIIIYGIIKDSRLINLFDERGRKLDVSNNLIITRPLANKLGLKEGDSIAIKNKFNDKRYTLKIQKIAALSTGNNGYLEIESFNSMFGFGKDDYIGIFSKESLNLDKNMVFESFSKSELVDSFKKSAQDLSKSIGVIALFSAIIALLIVYVLSNLTLNENKKNIGILKMLGFKENDIFKMMLGFNNISFIIGFILGIPLSKLTMDGLIAQATKDIDFAMSLDLSLQSITSTFVIFGVVYVISRLLAKRKMSKLMPVEILREQVD